MSLTDRFLELTDTAQVDQFLNQHKLCAFFKAGGCHKTMQGFGYVQQALENRENIHVAAVRVIDNRSVSNYIAELTGIKHESPQFILMKDKQPVYDVDNWNITLEELESALTKHVGVTDPQSKSEVNKVTSPTITPYKDLLSRFIQEEISQQEFENQWLMSFRDDSSLRSTTEFNLLNSLFGDVDAELSKRQEFVGLKSKLSCSSSDDSLKTKAKTLLKKLESV